MKSAKSLYVALLAGTVWYGLPSGKERIRRAFQQGCLRPLLVRDIFSALLERSFFAQDDFPMAHELVVQP